MRGGRGRARLLSPESLESGTWSTHAKQVRDPRMVHKLLTWRENRNNEEGGEIEMTDGSHHSVTQRHA
jgi:hypothetical protein